MKNNKIILLASDQFPDKKAYFLLVYTFVLYARGMKTGIICVVSVLLITILLLEVISTAKVQYQYKKYTYRKKRDDKTYKNAKQPCEVNPDCLAKRGAQQAICIRQCVSPVCYQDIYAHDELEEGEIDVRLNSFKGCVAQKR